MTDSIKITRGASKRFKALNCTVEHILELYKSNSIMQVAELVGGDYYVVRRILVLSGVKLRSKGNNSIGKSRIKYGIAGIAAKRGWNVGSMARIFAIKKLGGKCVKCGCADWRVLQLNHINGVKPRHGVYYEQQKMLVMEAIKIALGESNCHVEVLCANCNVVHEYERGMRPAAEKFISSSTGQLTALYDSAEREFLSLTKVCST